MRGYFSHIGEKTYIDRYPPSIISLEDIQGKTVVEIGCGIGNDALHMMRNRVNPENLWLVECNLAYLVEALSRIDDIYSNSDAVCEQFTYQHRDQYHHMGVADIPFPEGFADFVYCNNVLLCLRGLNLGEELAVMSDKVQTYIPQTRKPPMLDYALLSPKEKMGKLFSEAYRILKSGGILFGRTFSDHVDDERMKALETKDDEDSQFQLRNARQMLRGDLTGISPEELTEIAISSGFRNSLTELKASDWKPVEYFFFRYEK